MKNNRFVLKIGGESGYGINVMGEILTKMFKNMGFYVFGYREYPSLIQGGYASYQVDISNSPINSPSKNCDVFVGLNRVAVQKYYNSLNPNGLILHSLPKLNFIAQATDYISQNNIQTHFLDLETLLSLTHPEIRQFGNICLAAAALKIVRVESSNFIDEVSKRFASKPKLLEKDVELIEKIYQVELPEFTNSKVFSSLTPSVATRIINPITESEDADKVSLSEVPSYFLQEELKDEGEGRNEAAIIGNLHIRDLIITGNEALALGAVKAGVRAYYAYPMTPSSTVLTYLTEIAPKTNMLVKQVEDEISAAQLALGSMFMGTRALTGTSGGGFDLMTETVSLSGITETPLVIILAQRPGPATGLPTWTMASDLNVALYSGHGEYAKCIIAASDAKSAFELIQHSFNIAEKFQIPVIILTEKQIGESLFQVDNLDSNIPIERNLATNLTESDKRYKITEDGISPRWLPGQSEYTFVANSDEHLEDGSLTEEAESSEKMYKKRMIKLESLKKSLPDPVLYSSPEKSSILFVGWGAVKNTVLDVQTLSQKAFDYLHYEYLWPLKIEKFTELLDKYQKIVLIENNYDGQLGRLISSETGYLFTQKLLKYDGRPFFIEDIINFINEL